MVPFVLQSFSLTLYKAVTSPKQRPRNGPFRSTVTFLDSLEGRQLVPRVGPCHSSALFFVPLKGEHFLKMNTSLSLKHKGK